MNLDAQAFCADFKLWYVVQYLINQYIDFGY